MKDLETRSASAFARLLLKGPRVALALLLLVVGGSVALATGLTINANQLELLDPELRQVQDVQRVVDMVGGAGHLIIALRGSDETALKQVADDLAAALEADDEHIRTVSHKIDTSFVRYKAPLFMETEDLVELRRRVDVFLKDRLKRANPFFFEIVETEPATLEVQDFLDKYSRIGKRTIADDYWISDDKEMLLLVVKPMWDSTDLERTGELVETLRARFDAYAGDLGVTLVEDYDPEPAADPKVVEYGFTGSYKLGYDEQYEIQRSLVPVSGLALAGVFGVMLVFFRRRVGAVLLVVTGLLLGVAVAFGFAELAVGELNMVTSILGGILMGLGIDFGIHVVYRMREQLALGQTVRDAVRETITHQGPASFISAAGIGVAFFSLLFSDFRGFSQFGLLAGAGVFLIGLTIYVWVPALLAAFGSRWPTAPARILGSPDPLTAPPAKSDRVPHPRLLLAVSVGVVLVLAAFAPGVKFDYNTRTLSVENQASVVLNDEIGERFDLSSDPAAIYTATLEEAKRLYDHLSAGSFETLDQVVSPFSFVPPRGQQERNAAILKDWKTDLARIDRAVVPAEYRDKWDEAMRLLDAEPFGVDDLPPDVLAKFKHLPTTRPENHGWLTFVYPQVDVWDGREIVRFADELEEIELADGTVHHTAGLTILYAKLAEMVLKDARVSVALTSLLLLVILLLDLRSLTSALVALLPLVGGVATLFGLMSLLGLKLNFMNIVVFPIVLGYGLSHGVYLMHRFNEGTSPRAALRSVGTAVAASTLTTLAGWAALMAAPHGGLKTMGVLACLGMASTLLVSFTVMPAVLQLLHDRRLARAGGAAAAEPREDGRAAA